MKKIYIHEAPLHPSNNTPMMFAIGNHIAFKVPFLPGTDPAAMTFESPNRKQLLRNSLGFVNGEEIVSSFETPQRLGDFGAHVTLALTGYQSAPYAVLTDPHGLSIHVSQQATSSLSEPIVRFNIYGGPKVGYCGPEPWFGLQNSLYIGAKDPGIRSGCERGTPPTSGFYLEHRWRS